MKLNLIADQETNKINIRLGISDHRFKELLLFLDQLSDEVSAKIGFTKLPEMYKRIADVCENIQEYTLCMHLFCFFLTRSGFLASEAPVIN